MRFGPPHLTLNPPHIFVFCGFLFSFFAFNRKIVSPQKGHFLFVLQCLPSFLLSLFSSPFFTFSCSVSLLFLSLPYLFSSFLLCFASLVLSFCFFLFFLCFCFTKRTTSNIKFKSLFFIIFLCLWVCCLLFSFKSLVLIFVCVSWFEVLLFVQHQCVFFIFSEKQVKNTNFWSRGGGWNITVF